MTSKNLAKNSAVVIHGKGQLELNQRELRQASPSECLVEIHYGGICGSDLHYWREGAVGASVLASPMVLGHEVSGIVIKAARDGSGPKVGARVAVHPASHGAPGAPQLKHRPNLWTGGSYLGSAARTPHNDGAFSQLVVLPSRMLRTIPEELSLRTAVLAEPASVAWHAVEQAGDVSGKTVLVNGCGPIRALTIAILKLKGARSIVAVDLHDRPLKVAKELGADSIIYADPSGTLDGNEFGRQLAQVQAEIVIEASGHPPGLEAALESARPGGKIVLVGMLPSGPIRTTLAQIITRELEIVGSYRFNNEFETVVQALADGSLDVEGVITHEYSYTDFLKGFETAADSTISSKVILKFTE